MTFLKTQLSFRKFVAFGSMEAVILWCAIGRAQTTGVTFTPTSDLQELEQKVESRSKLPTLTTEEESALASKGYVKLGSITSTSTETGAGIAKELDDSVLSRAAAVGGDVVRFDKRGVPTQVTKTIGPKEKTKTTCADWSEQTTYTLEREPEFCTTDRNNIRQCTGGGMKEVPHTTKTCARWDTEVSEVGKETTLTTSFLTNEGTVWRYDPNLLAAIALQQRDNANAPSSSEANKFFDAMYKAATATYQRTYDLARVEAMLRDSPRLANTVGYPALIPAKPLGYAAFFGDKELIDILLAHGARINGRDRRGQTALFQMLDVDSKAAEIAEYLISKGADVNAEDNDGHTPLYYRLTKYKPTKGDKRIASVLRQHGGHE
jgi:hypothetical protein